MGGRSQEFWIAQASAESMQLHEFSDVAEQLTTPTNQEINQMIRRQMKADRKSHKKDNPGKCKQWYRKLAKRLRGKPKLSFKGVTRNGNKEKFFEEIALCVHRYVHAMHEYENRKDRRN